MSTKISLASIGVRIFSASICLRFILNMVTEVDFSDVRNNFGQGLLVHEYPVRSYSELKGLVTLFVMPIRLHVFVFS